MGDAGTASSKAGSDVRREDITRPSWPDYHGKMTPGAMEAGLAAAGAAEVGRTPAPPRIQKIEEGPAPEAAERGKGTGSGTAGPGPLLRRRRHGTPGPPAKRATLVKL